jgi:hypothetical protein
MTSESPSKGAGSKFRYQSTIQISLLPLLAKGADHSGALRSGSTSPLQAAGKVSSNSCNVLNRGDAICRVSRF